MSDEALPGERIRPSATVMLTRRAPHLEVYLAKRSTRTRFFPGYHVFPGGVLDPSDTEGPGSSRRRAALRELFEETGVLVTDKPAPAEFPRAQARAMLQKGERIRDLLQTHGIDWGIERVTHAGKLLTPPFAPMRYDTDFYVLECPDGEAPDVDGTELVEGAWWRPEDALAKWRDDAFPLPPPTLAYLRLLATTNDAEKAAALGKATDGRPHHERFRIELHPGVYALPLRAPTLPPATTQNCYLLDGRVIAVIDPGTPHDEERVALTYTIDAMRNQDPRDVVIVLTHHHHDHVASAAYLKVKYGARVLAHPTTAAALPEALVDETFDEGDELDLGEWAGRLWKLRALHTPGHTHGHLALRDERWGALFVGDLVSGVSTILVDPREGDMGAYMASLTRLAELNPPLLLPGHGPLLPGKGALTHTLEHRKMREGKVRAALTATPQGLDALVPIVYADTPEAAWPLACLSLASHLLELERRGDAARTGDAWARKA